MLLKFSNLIINNSNYLVELKKVLLHRPAHQMIGQFVRCSLPEILFLPRTTSLEFSEIMNNLENNRLCEAQRV